MFSEEETNAAAIALVGYTHGFLSFVRWTALGYVNGVIIALGLTQLSFYCISGEAGNGLLPHDKLLSNRVWPFEHFTNDLPSNEIATLSELVSNTF